MKRISATQFRRRLRREMGSALLVALMVMVVLSLLGVAYVTMSETENLISANERDMVEALYGAELGAKFMVEWFQNPDPSRGNAANENSDDFLPVRADCSFNLIDGAEYKNGTIGALTLFDKPYRGAKPNTLRGDEDIPDLFITAPTGVENAFLGLKNLEWFGVDQDADGTNDQLGRVRITDVRIYGPPIIDGNRYGIGTIRATASKFRVDAATGDAFGDPTATRSVTVVLNEVRFPAPSGPVQAQGAIGSGGNVKVHWGEIVSHEANLTFPNGANSLQHGVPWMSQTETAPFDSDQVYDAAGAPVAPGTAGAKNVYQLLQGVNLEDPWIRARADQDVTDWCTNCCCDMVDGERWMDAPTTATAPTKYSNVFPNDDTTKFPDIRYKIWKKAVSGRSRNLHYFKWINDNEYKERGIGAAKTIRDWTNILDGNGKPNWRNAGVYFFDTKNSKNPQSGDDNQGGQLAPEDVWNGGTQLAAGFLYLNLEAFKIKTSSPWYSVPWPGETINIFWKDINPHRNPVNGVAEDHFWVGGTWVKQGDMAPGGTIALAVPAAKITEMEAQWSGSTEWFFLDAEDSYNTKGYKDAEDYNPNDDPSKPFLNLVYNENCCLGNNPPTNAAVGRDAENTVGQLMDKCENCGGDPQVEYKWTKGADRNGAGAKMDASIYGVVYNEGNWGDGGAGGGRIFGSIIVEGEFDSKGTTDIFFDERLIKDAWPPAEWELPRVKAAAWKQE